MPQISEEKVYTESELLRLVADTVQQIKVVTGIGSFFEDNTNHAQYPHTMQLCKRTVHKLWKQLGMFEHAMNIYENAKEEK